MLGYAVGVVSVKEDKACAEADTIHHIWDSRDSIAMDAFAFIQMRRANIFPGIPDPFSFLRG